MAAQPVVQEIPQRPVGLLAEDCHGVNEHGGQQVFAPTVGVGVDRDDQ